jgi:hypothetical protein
MTRTLAVCAVFLLSGCSKPDQSESNETAQPVTTAAAVTASVELAPTAPPKIAIPLAPLTPKPGTLRLAHEYEGEPLGSEQAAIDTFTAYLAKHGGPTVDRNPITEAETEYLARYREAANASKSLPELPHAWGGFETVLVLSMRAPRGEPGRRLTGGTKARLLVAPPNKTPTYSLLFEDHGGTPVDGNRLAQWVLEDTLTRTAERGAARSGTGATK